MTNRVSLGRAEVYRDESGDYRWRLKSKNGRILADSGQGYKRRVDCVRGLEAVTGTTYWEQPDEGPSLIPTSLHRTFRVVDAR